MSRFHKSSYNIFKRNFEAGNKIFTFNLKSQEYHHLINFVLKRAIYAYTCIQQDLASVCMQAHAGMGYSVM